MNTMPIVAVSDIAATVAFYRALGFEPHHQGPRWAELRRGQAIIGLHTAPELPPVEPARVHFSLIANERLEGVVARLQGAGVPLERGIGDESFGRSILLRDLDGMPLQVNEYDLALFTPGDPGAR